MSRGRRLFRAGAVVAAALMSVPVVPMEASARPPNRRPAQSVTISVDDLSPTVPTPSAKPQPLTVSLTLVNTTSAAIPKVSVLGERGNPIGSQAELDRVIKDPTPPSDGGLPITPTKPVRVDLPAGGIAHVSFTTTTGIPTDAGICLCAQAAIYPLFFSAHVAGPGGVDQSLGVTATYLPAFYARPKPVRVNWVWPLIDRPHRLSDSAVFTDDELAAEVGPDGRLTRALEVVRQVGGQVPLTLVLDPELLDELQVMSTGRYTVAVGGKATPGTGQAVAAAWLSELRTVLSADSGLRLQFTPYADPDMTSLAMNGLRWSAAMPADMAGRVAAALGGRQPTTDIAWPASGVVGSDTLRTLVKDGIDTVVLDSGAISRSTVPGTAPSGLARLRSGDTDVAAALTSATVEQQVSRIVGLGGAGTAELPALLAELAVPATTEPGAEHIAVLTAPRYVDPAVPAAVRTIVETSRSTFTDAVPLDQAVAGSLLPTGRSRLATVRSAAATLPEANLRAAQHATVQLPAVASLLDDKRSVTARQLVTGLPVAVQRTESSAWRTDNVPFVDSGYPAALVTQVDAVLGGVHIVRPSSGAYTLASSSSPLPITVDNTLPYPVDVRVEVQTVVNGLPGFRTQDIGVQAIESESKRILQLPTTIERSGRIQVRAVLLTPDRSVLGEQELTVRSTALGLIGVIITIAAGVVLVLALLVRVIRRWRARSAVAGTGEPGGAAPAAQGADPAPDGRPPAAPAPATGSAEREPAP